MSTSQQRVLVTGGAGFIGIHCIMQLLQEGYLVRTTVRSAEREAQLRSMLSLAGQQPGDALSFVVADLESDLGWSEAVADCGFVLHVASPLPHGEPKNEDEVIVPAREGALRVLRAARDAGVKRVVLTSAFHAIGFGYGRTDHEFTEADWSRLDGPGISTYNKSKTLTERAAWDFLANSGGDLELTVLNPVAVFGPLFNKSTSGGNDVIRRLLVGELPGYADFWFPIVDVRDVAKAHVRAMTSPQAAGERLIIGSGSSLSMKQICLLLREHFGAQASRVPHRSIPSFVLRFAAIFNKGLREMTADLGVIKKINVEKARRILGPAAYTPEEAVLATAESLLKLGVVSE
ncbi:SDR family oxidoreductase [Psychromicrobium sp. YIM B11713]|uniref:SDR family oxidoreductase n=1 Tax=Psychromicrobium sp. YIM B11713 TaxID=3145233 RepID=UPI00374E804B